ncbi:hypothetical protein NMG60_11016726 [Bertholletia excelsa]
MEFDGHDDPDEEIEVPGQGNSGDGRDTAESSGQAARKGGGYRYRECMKNHAVGIGSHAVDGCGEFMAAGEEGTLDSLKCAACSCHRNFHRKEAEGEPLPYHHHHPPPPPHHHHHYYRPTGYLHVAPPVGPVRPLALPSTAREEEDLSNPSTSGGGGGSGSSKKRFRTKFTQEQKERMLEFAERVGWRLQKQDEAEVERFCAQTG